MRQEEALVEAMPFLQTEDKEAVPEAPQGVAVHVALPNHNIHYYLRFYKKKMLLVL
jgi:hypothetical protein